MKGDVENRQLKGTTLLEIDDRSSALRMNYKIHFDLQNEIP